jgi:hypothetical protein
MAVPCDIGRGVKNILLIPPINKYDGLVAHKIYYIILLEKVLICTNVINVTEGDVSVVMSLPSIKKNF